MGQIGMKKRPSKIKPQTGTVGAKRRQALSVLSVSSPCLSVSLRAISSVKFPQFWSAIFTLKIRESPQFLRRNRIWILPVDRHITTNQKNRSCDTVVNRRCTQNRGYSDTFFDCFWFCSIDTVKLVAWKQVSG